MSAPALDRGDVKVWVGDARTVWADLPAVSADAIVTSPPYFGLRDYQVDGQLGLEATPDEYVTTLADLLTAWGTSVMKPEGSLWLNLGDTYNSYPGNRGEGTVQSAARHDALPALPPGYGLTAKNFSAKCLLMIPERVALALIDRRWILRNKVIWAKSNAMPSSATDRLATKWEHLFHFVRQPRYWYDLDAIREPHKRIAAGPKNTEWVESTSWNHNRLGEVGSHPNGANPGDVWPIATSPNPQAHFACFPPELIRRPILATVPEGGVVADPFIGSGTTAHMARRLGRRCYGAELNPAYLPLIEQRVGDDRLPLLTEDDTA